MSSVYFISGLGADYRVFQFLKIESQKQKHLVWEKPFKNESIQSYCTRLILQIDQTKEIILIGVSFGGIIAQEISRLIPVKKIILISSIKSEEEMDWQLKLVSKTKIHRLFPVSLLKWSNLLIGDYYFGTHSKFESELLKEIIKDTDLDFLPWAIEKIMSWKSKGIPCPYLHIHGTKDKIFPSNTIQDFIAIKNGGHFMIVNRAEEISLLINKAL